MTIDRLLVANRGEIARRVFRTCRDLGIATVAVHSDADAGLAFVREADVAVRLPGRTPAETYLRADLLVQAALDAGADAVHPGYGFLSESAHFARQVTGAGLTWVGPTPASMELMGSKVTAKRLMAEVGVPVLPQLSAADVTEADLPVLVKASAGGGGRGMRRVRSVAALAGALEQASAEAASAFGDPTVFCEPYVEHGRHVEVQVWADHAGNVSVLGERDCSVQRRHQKLVEEAPAGHLHPDLREQLHTAARTAARAVGYVGVGTVEFLVSGESPGAATVPGEDPAGIRPRVAFLEMNTRLQVEHPVTEAVTGLDLVALQIQAAERGPAQTYVVEPQGHAVEARLYAEDPAHDHQPQSGRLTRFEIPGSVGFTSTREGVRVDAGYQAGDEVGTHYDAMLAKVVAWAPTRRLALRRLAAALERAQIHGVRTNRDLLVEVLRHPRMVADEVTTAFLDEVPLRSREPGGPPGTTTQQALACFAAAVTRAECAAARRPVQACVPTGWRNVVSGPQVTTFDLDGTEVRVGWLGGRDGYRFLDVHDEVHGARATAVGHGSGSGSDLVRVRVEHDGVTHAFEVHLHGGRVDVESPSGHLALTVVPRFVDPADQVAGGSLLAPLPGTVVLLHLAPGDRVTAGEPVLVLEAMKMQHPVTAPHDGEVVEVAVGVGSHVAAGAVLAVVRPSTHAGSPAHEGEAP